MTLAFLFTLSVLLALLCLLNADGNGHRESSTRTDSRSKEELKPSPSIHQRVLVGKIWDRECFSGWLRGGGGMTMRFFKVPTHLPV